MKEKIKRFFIEKKELLIFIGVVLFVFTAVITVASLAINSRSKPVSTPGTETPETPTIEPSTQQPSATITPPSLFELPISGEYVIARGFFDPSLSDEELQNCMIDTGSKIIASTGISYKKENNDIFSALAINDGEVVSIVNDELAGATITIKHSDGMKSIYSSLDDVKVSIGDYVSKGNEIALASASINDAASGIHVYLQVMVDDRYVNPSSVYGKEISEFDNSK